MRGLSLLAALVAASCADGQEAFREVGQARGVSFRHSVRAAGEYRIAEQLGSGCAVFDADGDGRLDLYFMNAGDGPGEGAPNELFLQAEDGTFVDGTATSGLGDTGFGLGVATADVDNDGDLDVYCGNWGADALYLNDGAGRFTKAAPDAGLAGDGLTTSVGFFDFDLDGFLDLFVVRYVDPFLLTDGTRPVDLDEFLGPNVYVHLDDLLYRNRGDGTFEDVSEQAGISGRPGAGFGLILDDFDEDGRVDAYVANDGVRNHLWINEGNGRFVEDAIPAGVALNSQGAVEASMGVASGDVDGDGRPDLFLTHLSGETNTLYRSLSGGSFVDASGQAGLAGPSVALTGWGAALFDAENDGDLDLVVANGSIWRLKTVYPGPGRHPWDAYAEPNQMYLNGGKGVFTDATPLVPGFWEQAESSRGLVAADLDGDGDVDFVVTNIDGPARVFENTWDLGGHFLRVRAVDPRLKRDALGARVRLRAGERWWVATVGTTTSYLCSVPPTLHFGLGGVDTIDEAVVVWPGGESETFEVEDVDTEVVFERGSGAR